MRFFPALRFVPGFVPGIFCAILIYGASLLGWTQSVERLSLDALFRARGPRDADPRVVIIAVDDAAVVRAGERSGVGWPLPRRYYARAVHDLKTLGAKTIAFDVLFSEPGPSPEQDLELARQCRAASVAQACAFQVAQRRTELPLDIAASPLPLRFSLGSADSSIAPSSHFSNVRSAIWASAPLLPLGQGAATLGHVNVFPEVSGTLRRVPHVINWRGEFFPSLSLAASAQFLGEKPHLDVTNNRITLAKRQIPLDNDGLSLINWIGAGDSYPKFGLNQLLDGEVPTEAIRGRLVLIGVTALGAFENRATPFAGGVPAIDFQANAIDDILSNRLLQGVAWPFSLALLWGFPVVCAVVTARRGGKNVWPVPLLIFCLAVVGWLGLRSNFYLPIGAPLLGGAMAFALTAALGYRREWEAVARSDVAVSSLARGTTLLSAALVTSGRDREHLISIIRATAHETLGARDVFLILDDDPSPLSASPGQTESEMSSATRAVFAARHAQELGTSWVFPAPDRGSSGLRRRRARLSSHSDEQRKIERRKSEARLEKRAFKISDLWTSGAPFSSQSRAAKSALFAGETLIAVPLPRRGVESVLQSNESQSNESQVSESQIPAPPRQFGGALVAIGKRDVGSFSARDTFNARDAVLLETLAEGAALALENFDYAQALRGRIESTNRDLETAYQLLAEQSAKLFAAVESIDAAIVVCDATGHAAFVNPAGARVLRGATPILGEPVVSALAAGDLEELAALFQTPHFSKLETELEAAHVASIRLETTRGHEILVAQFTPLVSDENQFIGAMLVVSDVSAQRELERMKTDFVGFVAHELRTPLTTILGYASLLHQAAGRFSADETRDMTSVIERHCRRMNSMISDLLDISRLESGRSLSVQRAWFDLDHLCARLLGEQKHYLNATPPLELRLECETRPLELFGDSDRIEQVVLNLLSNAVKYSPDGGVITVALQKTEKNVVLEVRDQGLGLSGAQIERMFQKFYRTPDAQARGIKGNGLGLNLVRQIVEAHAGTIEVFSRRDEGQRGSTFRVTLPGQAES
ncbi:Signal transduction histidine kinase [Abditibacterium utsteinense]|uniref:histidine kinase n=1 Tax=Abditibacterium utsteinense TaxID=1960156 RepID=A0A2S8SP36_9BACT|nr:CHASE2 domain-containing protein [Abditibacterium utsteinense]PQV62565.1 Signal transduction histidine kinase [Abditibacterium utsteinense]